NVAPGRDRGSGRLATRHLDRRYRPFLPRSAEGMEIHLPAGRGMSRRASHRDDCLQDPTGALGEGTHPDRQEDFASRAPQRRPTAYQDRGLVSSDRQHQLSPDDHALGAAAAGHDHPLLPGLVPNALHRPAFVSGFDVLDLELLPGVPKGTVSQEMASRPALSAIPDGAWNWPYHHQHQGRY